MNNPDSIAFEHEQECHTVSAKSRQDTLLQSLADILIQEELRYIGGMFEHPSGQPFTLTIAKESAERKLHLRNQQLESALSAALEYILLNPPASTTSPQYDIVGAILQGVFPENSTGEK